jgi:hypothetical protein
LEQDVQIAVGSPSLWRTGSPGARFASPVASLWYNQHAKLAPHLHTGRRQQRTLFAQQGAKTNDGDLSTRPVTASGLVSKDFHCHSCLMSEYDIWNRATISDSMAHQTQQICGVPVSPSKILVSTVCGILLHTGTQTWWPWTDSHRLCCENHRE